MDKTFFLHIMKWQKTATIYYKIEYKTIIIYTLHNIDGCYTEFFWCAAFFDGIPVTLWNRQKGSTKTEVA